MNEMKQLCQQYDIHPDAEAFLTEAYSKLEANKEAFAIFEQQVAVYRQDYLFDHKPVMEKLHALEALTDVSWMTVDMLYMIRLFPILQALYRKENLDEAMFYGFVGNVKASLQGGKRFYGTRIAWWFMDFFKLK